MQYPSPERNCDHHRRRIRKCGSVCNAVIVVFTLMIILMLIATYTMNMTQRIHIVYIDTDKPTFETSDRFLSIALDTIVVADDFKGFNMSNHRLLKMIEALSPAHFRIGGNMADRLIFTDTDEFSPLPNHIVEELAQHDCTFTERICRFLNKPNFTMNARQWLQLNELARKTGLDLLFDLNALRRFKNESWDYRNAEKLIAFSDQNNLSVDWELGNEPNSFRHQFNYEVSPDQLAEDFQTLKNILNKYSRYKQSLLVGPDTTRPRVHHKESDKYLRAFLLDGAHAIDAITWHHYYINGRNATLENFLDPLLLDVLKWQILTVKDIARFARASDKPIWLGETASAYGGGAPGLSDRFVASFMWLDKLGIAAEMGLSVVMRQSIFRGNYALIDDDYNPTPDWWVSVLYKRLVSPKIVQCYTAMSPKVRFYCQCTKSDNSYHSKPSVTVFGMNMDQHRARVRIEGILPPGADESDIMFVDAYTLTTPTTLVSRQVLLNGCPLRLTATDDVPIFKPRVVPTHPYIEMPPFSLVFWVVPVGSKSSC